MLDKFLSKETDQEIAEIIAQREINGGDCENYLFDVLMEGIEGLQTISRDDLKDRLKNLFLDDPESIIDAYEIQRGKRPKKLLEIASVILKRKVK